jgi:C4-dicarboxylate transporter, DctQ subunit
LSQLPYVSTLSSNAPARVLNLLWVWYWIERFLSIVTFGCIGLLLMYDVITREIVRPILASLSMSGAFLTFIGTQKVAVYLLIAGAFAGFSLATATGTQLVPKVGFKWAPRSWDASLNRLGDLMSGLFLATVSYYAIVFVRSSAEAGLMTSTGFEAPVWILQVVIPIGFASAAGRYLVYALWPATRPLPPDFQE